MAYTVISHGDDTTDLLPWQLRKYKLVCLVPWQNVISVATLRHQCDVIVAGPLSAVGRAPDS